MTLARSATRCIALAAALAVVAGDLEAAAATRRYVGPAEAAGREATGPLAPTPASEPEPQPEASDGLGAPADSLEPPPPTDAPTEPEDVAGPTAPSVDPARPIAPPVATREDLDDALDDDGVEPDGTVYDEVRDSPEGRVATRRIRGGIMMLAAGGLLGIGAIVLGTIDPCRRLAGNSCMATARNRGALSMGIPGLLVVGGGAALLGVGMHTRRRISAGMQADRRSAGVVISGRF